MLKFSSRFYMLTDPYYEYKSLYLSQKPEKLCYNQLNLKKKEKTRHQQ